MTDTAEDRPPEETKRCCVCGETIHRSARKCIKCGSYQDWRRYTDLVPAPLPWIAAAATAMVAVWPLVSAAFHRPNSELVFSNPDFNISQTSFFVNNRGDRPGVLKNLRLKLPNGNSLLLFVSHGSGVVIPPNESRYIELPISSFDRDKELFESVSGIQHPPSKKCSAEFSVANFRTGDAKITTGLDCGIFETLSAASAMQRMVPSLRPKAGEAFRMVYCDPHCMRRSGPPTRASISEPHGPDSPDNAATPKPPAP